MAIEAHTLIGLYINVCTEGKVVRICVCGNGAILIWFYQFFFVVFFVRLSADGVVLAICDRTDHLSILADENPAKRTQIE